MRINIIEHFWKAKMKMRFQQVGTNRQMNCALNSNKKFVFNIAGGQNSIVRCLFKIQLLQKFNYLKWPWRWLKHILHIHTRPFEWLEYLFECESYFFFVFIHWNSPNNVSIEKFDAINVTRDFLASDQLSFLWKFMRFSHDTILYVFLLKEKPDKKKMMPN